MFTQKVVVLGTSLWAAQKPIALLVGSELIKSYMSLPSRRERL